MNDKNVTLEFSRDGGKTWEAIGEARVDLSDPKTWGTVDSLSSDSEALLMGHGEAAGVENKQMRVYSSMSMSGSFTFKPKKAPKVRQTPPFWSAYK